MVTEEEAEEIIKDLERGFGTSQSNLHQFLTNVVKAENTLKLGNVKEEELGEIRNPIRTLKELEVFAKDVGMIELSDHFKSSAEIITASSLSKEGFLVRQATLQRKEFSDRTPMGKRKRDRRGLFSRKEESVEEP